VDSDSSRKLIRHVLPSLLFIDQAMLTRKSLTDKDKEALKKEKNPILKGDGPGLSIFLKEGNEVFHTYSTYSRGLDGLLVTYKLLELTPLGRQDEDNGEWKRHDEYTGDLGKRKACH
jgi:predicted dithiol-disulfide oxidoreductase (DUF899 family)